MKRVACALCVVLLAGCGGDSASTDDGDNSAERFRGAEREVAQEIEDYVAAVRGNEWEKICDELLEPGYRDAAISPVDPPCPEVVEERYDRFDDLTVTVEDVLLRDSERIPTAVVVVRTSEAPRDQFNVIQLKDDWQINGLSRTLALN